MLYAKYAMMVFGLLGAILSMAYGLLSAGGHGIAVLVGCLLPVALGAFSIVKKTGMPRWASIVSAIGLLLAGMKTREGSDLQNIMLVAFFGMILAIALAIKPDKPKQGVAEGVADSF